MLIEVSWRGRLRTNAEQGATAAKVGVRRVVEGVPFEDTVLIPGADRFELADQFRHRGNAELDLNLAIGAPMSRHICASIA